MFTERDVLKWLPGVSAQSVPVFGCVALKSLFHSPYRVFCVCPVFGLRRPLRSEQGSLLQSYQHLRAWFTFVISMGFLKRSDRAVIWWRSETVCPHVAWKRLSQSSCGCFSFFHLIVLSTFLDTNPSPLVFQCDWMVTRIYAVVI